MKTWWLLPLLLLFSLIATPLAAGVTPLDLGGPVAAHSQAGAPVDSPLLLDWYFDGDQNGDEVGHSVASAGDVNGDGYDDVIVGAPHDTDTIYKEGVAYLFFGSASGLSSEPDWVAGSEQKGSLFGAAVAASDVNGDGYDDVIVGAYGYRNEDIPTGAIFVYYGSETGLSATPDWTFLTNVKDADLGYSVASAGDVNGDDYGDIVVGARWYTNEQINEGAAFVFYGSDEGLSATPDWMVEGDVASAGFGTSASTAGDVNGDDYDDVIVGAPYGTDSPGTAYLFYGSDTGLDPEPGWVASLDQAEAQFGASVASAGDVNGDTYADVIVGAPFYDTALADGGAAFAFYGSDSGPNTDYDWTAVSNQEGSRYGCSVNMAGDVDGDGYMDVIVGAYRYELGQSEEGAAFIYHGSTAGLRSTHGWWAEGNKAGTQFGFAASTAGDVNHDGFADVVVGAPRYQHDDREFQGRACGFYGPIYPLSPTRIYLPLLVREIP